MTANKIDVTESACKEYSQEEADAILGLEDDPDSPKINPFYYDPEGDILLLEAILNKVELKDLPHHLEYVFLEGDKKLPVIIAKELGRPDDLLVPDLRTMKELCQPSLNGRGGPIAPIAIQAKNFGLKNDMIQQVHNSYQFHGLPDTFYSGLTLRHRDNINAAAEGTFMKRRPEECYDLIENMTTHHNDWDTLAQLSESSSSITSSFDTEITALKAEMAKINKNLMRVFQVNQQVKAVTPNCKTCGGPHSFSDCPATVGNTQNVYAAGAYMGASHGQNPPPAYQAPAYQAPGYQAPVHQPQIPQPQVVTTNEFTNFMKGNDAILKNMQTNMTSLTNLNFKLKNIFGLFMKMNTAYLRVRELSQAAKDTVHPTNNGSTEDVQTPGVQTESPILNSEPVITPIIEPVASPVSASKPNQRPSISLSLPDLSPTCMTLELSDRWISHTVGVTEDVFVKVGTFYFPADFVVVDFDADPRVPLFLGRSFLKARRALIDVFEGELTLRVNKEAITFNLDQTSRYSANYNDMTANQIDFIDMACEEYSQEVLGFSNVIKLMLFKLSKMIILYQKLIQSYVDTEGDILLLEAFLNDDPLLPPQNQGNYMPQVRKELKICEAKSDKSLIDEPPEVELKDLPPHLEYAFLEGDDKFPVIIAKYLSVEEKTTLITVLKSHKRAIAWKLSDIKGIDPGFCTHKILMEEDFKPAVQPQRRVNPKIHDVIKNKVLKLLDAGLIYPISDSPCVSPVHCVPKNDGFTVVENEKNELILTRLVTGWRVCIDYRKLNEATRKDHFPLPFMNQMLERLAGNQYYCFLDGFSGYFQIHIDPKDQEKTTFTCPYRTFAYRRMPFGLCNAPGTFQRCMMSIFHDMIEKTMEVFMDDFSEKSHFMVKEGIVLSHKISKNGIEVDKAKVDAIAKLPHPITVKCIRSFLGHAGFYRRFIQDFSKLARPMTRLLEKDTPFFFSKECVEAFQTLKRKLTEASILIAPD
nr:reverse transcriptase domain-containing protein [Tanacetum cinerariifolium]